MEELGVIATCPGKPAEHHLEEFKITRFLVKLGRVDPQQRFTVGSTGSAKNHLNGIPGIGNPFRFRLFLLDLIQDARYFVVIVDNVFFRQLAKAQQ